MIEKVHEGRVVDGSTEEKFIYYGCCSIHDDVRNQHHRTFSSSFCQRVGITEPGAARMWSGLLIGIHALFAALVSPIWGSVADRYGRKLMVIRSCLGVAIFTFLMAYAQSVYHILLFTHPPGLLLRFFRSSP